MEHPALRFVPFDLALALRCNRSCQLHVRGEFCAIDYNIEFVDRSGFLEEGSRRLMNDSAGLVENLDVDLSLAIPLVCNRLRRIFQPIASIVIGLDAAEQIVLFPVEIENS